MSASHLIINQVNILSISHPQGRRRRMTTELTRIIMILSTDMIRGRVR